MARCQCGNGRMCPNPGTHRVPLKDLGGGYAFLCDFHYNNNELYIKKNNVKYGTPKVNETTHGVELECSYSDEIARIELLHMGYIPTHDGSIDDTEYKSPIYEGFSALSKQCVSIEALINEGHLRINSDCGTHLHIGHKTHINPVTMDYIRRFYHSLFIPLSEAIAADPEKARKFWGRNFTYYAQEINEYTDPIEHRNFINLQHNYTIEFRLCKFQSAKQYQNLVRFTKDVLITIINNFIVHFNDTNYNPDKFKNQTAYRKHQAAKTAKKIVMLYNKYTMNV